MRVIFLDFDGVLNSAASVKESIARRIATPDDSPVNEDLCPKLCAVFQSVLEALPDVKIVISSSWRNFFPLDKLQEKLQSYGVDGSRVIDITPTLHISSYARGNDISAWLEAHPEVIAYVVIDDMDDMTVHMDRLVLTKYDVGITEVDASKLLALLK